MKFSLIFRKKPTMIVMVLWIDMVLEGLVDLDEDFSEDLIPMIWVIYFLVFLVEGLVDSLLVLVKEQILVMISKSDFVFHWKMLYWVGVEK